MQDVQKQYDSRRMPIQKTGIKDLLYPIVVLDRQNKLQHTVGTVSMYVDLPHHYKGTHMSRFVEILNELRGKISVSTFDDMLATITKRFDSDTASLEIYFPYFVAKKAPVSKVESLMNYDCFFVANFNKAHHKQPLDLIVGVNVPIMTLCPCSKEISDYGAHNQRSIVTIQVRTSRLVWIEELIDTAEQSASAPLYSLLKREDEKYITETAYNRPRFAEDIARDVAVALKKDERIIWFKVESENFESIHNHNAYAMVTRNRDNTDVRKKKDFK
jgi:GTP cyclohydrolase IB